MRFELSKPNITERKYEDLKTRAMVKIEPRKSNRVLMFSKSGKKAVKRIEKKTTKPKIAN